MFSCPIFPFLGPISITAARGVAWRAIVGDS